MKTPDRNTLDWEKASGLIPAIIQEQLTRQVLMLGYMNPEALDRTVESGYVTFYSRSKQRLWMKGETSGNRLKVLDIMADCDEDALLVLVEKEGPCCHLNRSSCFGVESADWHVLDQLETMIENRKNTKPAGSYTARLLEEGIPRMAQKTGEEGLEVALAAVAGSTTDFLNECADLVFHLLVLIRGKDCTLQEVLHILSQRASGVFLT